MSTSESGSFDLRKLTDFLGVENCKNPRIYAVKFRVNKTINLGLRMTCYSRSNRKYKFTERQAWSHVLSTEADKTRIMQWLIATGVTVTYEDE